LARRSAGAAQRQRLRFVGEQCAGCARTRRSLVRDARLRLAVQDRRPASAGRWPGGFVLRLRAGRGSARLRLTRRGGAAQLDAGAVLDRGRGRRSPSARPPAACAPRWRSWAPDGRRAARSRAGRLTPSARHRQFAGCAQFREALSCRRRSSKRGALDRGWGDASPGHGRQGAPGAGALALGGPFDRAAGVLAFGSGFRIGAVASRAAGRRGGLDAFGSPASGQFARRARARGQRRDPATPNVSHSSG
jgi:hypothetical protein